MKNLLWLLPALLLLGAQDKSPTPAKTKADGILQRIAAGKDTVYVVNFWATWCAPCVKELPDFEKLDSAYRSKPVKVLLVSLDFESQVQTKLVPFMQKRNLHSEVLFLDEVHDNEWIPKIDAAWQGNIPATLIVHKGKNYRLFLPRSTNYAELDSLVRQAF
ncbi:MAG: TlpA family protein disulfide reductase [Bacteroidia bacterium]|nr:TlpA family protein disulfide reductase [Bacteroidia bacterium]